MKVRSVVSSIVIVGLCIVLSVVILKGFSIGIIKIEIPWIIGTFSAIGAVATAIVALLALWSNRTAIRAISRIEELDRVKSKHSIFMMERLAYELIGELIKIVGAGRKKGEGQGIPEAHMFRIPIGLTNKVENTSRSFIDLFQVVGSSILDQQRYNKIKYAAVMLTNLLQKKEPRIKEVEDALTAVTDVLPIDDDSKDV